MNWSLRLGIVGTALLLLIILFGPLLAPYSMDQIEHFRQVADAEGVMRTTQPPYPASSVYLLGTDQLGHDMLSILLRGARITVLFAVSVATLRLLIGLPLAYVGVMYPRTVGWLLEKLGTAFATVPMVLVVYIIVRGYNFSPVVSIPENLIITAFVVMFAGLFQTANLLQNKISSILQYSFIEGVKSIGTGKWKMFRKHVFPYMSIHLGILYMTEIANTLWLIAQLSVLLIFLGGTIFESGEPPVPRIPEEWGGKIGLGHRIFRIHPMIVLYPTIAISLGVLSFNLLANGIRKYNEQKWGINMK